MVGYTSGNFACTLEKFSKYIFLQKEQIKMFLAFHAMEHNFI